jgi:hypothetical protein
MQEGGMQACMLRQQQPTGLQTAQWLLRLQVLSVLGLLLQLLMVR